MEKKLKRILMLLMVCVSVFALSVPTYAAVKINKTKKTLCTGQTLQLKVKGTSSKVVWKTSKKSVATVTTKGKVSAKKKGTATITAKVGSKKLTCKITVESPELNSTKLSLTKDSTYQLKMKNTKQTYKWSSKNNSIATVSAKGKVTAKKAGTTYIYAKSASGKTFKCQVTVKNKVVPKGNISYTSQSTDYGVVVIAKNNYSYTVDLTVDCMYYKNGAMVGTGSDNCYALEAGRECALRMWESEVTWDSYKLNIKVEKASSSIITNASQIRVTSQLSNNRVVATVQNIGKKNEYTRVAVVYYNGSTIIGYEDLYADVKKQGDLDFLEFYQPYDRSYEDLEVTDYQIYVNESYTYDWLN